MKLSMRDIFLKYSVYILLVVLFLFFALTSPSFLSAGNVANFFRQIPPVGILTVAYAMVLVTGYVDLSIASIAAFCGVLAAYFSVLGLPVILVILLPIIAGALLGSVNGFLIKKLALPSFILTLGTNYVIRGLLMFSTNGIYVTGTPDYFRKIATTPILPAITQNLFFSNTLIFVIITLVFAYVMRNTRFGKYCYAIGSNQEAARLSGIKTDRHVIHVFAIEGALAAIAGILLMSNLNVGGPNEGQGLDLLALAAAIMGGTSFSGGVGTIGGAVVGILTLQLFTNGLAIMGVNAFMQQAVTGAVIILSIIIDYIRRVSEERS